MRLISARRPSTVSLLALIAALSTGVMPQVAVAVDDATAVAALSAQRVRNGLPPLTLSPARSAGCAAHNNYMALNGFGHGEIEGNPGWTPEGAMLAPDTSGAEVLAWGAPSGWDAAWASPWSSAPLHLAGMFNPAYTVAGYDETGTLACMRLNGDGPLEGGIRTLPGPGVDDVPTEVDARNESPISPGRAAGVGDHTGFNILVWRARGTDQLRGATLTAAGEPVDVSIVDSATQLASGDTWSWDVTVVVPHAPLAPATQHVLDLEFVDGVRHRLRFRTQAVSQEPGSGSLGAKGQDPPDQGGSDPVRQTPVSPARDVAAGGRMALRLRIHPRARTLRVVWRSADGVRTVRVVTPPGRVLRVAAPTVPGTYLVRVVARDSTVLRRRVVVG